ELVLATWRPRARDDGRRLFQLATNVLPGVPIIAVIEGAEPRDVSEALEAGVSDFAIAPVRAGDLLPRIWRLLERRGEPEVTSEVTGRLMGRSPRFVSEVRKIPLIARCDSGVLVQGETGTGKELFARAIHEQSRRAGKMFVPVNCGAIPVELAESELFGYERGAFTGAHAAHPGVIQQAEGGTLFLDEISALPLLVQAKLLRFLQEKEYRPLGSSAVRAADVRVVAAGNVQLEQCVRDGTFRRDLFYRLNVIPVLLPPLRQRVDDIPLLAGFFLGKFTRDLGRPAMGFSPGAFEKLVRYEWPGNVRELEHVIERAVVFSNEPTLRACDIALPDEAEETPEQSFRAAKARVVAQFERNYLSSLLAAHEGNITRAAHAAGKNRRALWELIRKHHIEVVPFRSGPDAGR
ncbi:MAG: sigma-54 dependent transcriptional regulator, partial [Chthoniobacteraceae bacterium]